VIFSGWLRFVGQLLNIICAVQHASPNQNIVTDHDLGRLEE
jgi:hypothetical protein